MSTGHVLPRWENGLVGAEGEGAVDVAEDGGLVVEVSGCGRPWPQARSGTCATSRDPPRSRPAASPSKNSTSRGWASAETSAL